MNKLKNIISDLKLAELWLRTRRGVLYGLILLAFLLVQNVIFSHITIAGAHAMFMPALVAAVALFEGGARGGWFGLAAGFLVDLFYAEQTVLFTILFPIMGFIIGLLADFYLNRRFVAYAVMAVIAIAAAAFVQMFSLLVYQGQSAFALFKTAFFQTLWSVPFIFPAYFICKMFPRRLGVDVPSPY